MAEFRLTSANPALTVISEVVEDTTITNESGSVVLVGSIIEEVLGNKTTKVLDADTVVEVRMGKSVTVKPVDGAIGVGMYTRDASARSTGGVVVVGKTVTKKAKK